MSQNSSIEWTDTTWSVVTGCTRASAGCDNCYAVRQSYRLEKMGQRKYAGLTVLNPAGDRHFNGTVKLHPHELTKPLAWKKPRKVFVNSMSDLFHRDVPEDFIGSVFDVMASAPRHTFQVLTKRPERAAEILPRLAARHSAPDGTGWPLSNVWLGTSVEDQQRADERIPHLLRCPAAVRFLSVEPMLGPIHLRSGIYSMPGLTSRGTTLQDIHWVIVGGESGGGARPFHIEWARSIVGQCKAAGVPVFVKQLGARPVGQEGVDVVTNRESEDRLSVTYKKVRPPAHVDDFERRHELYFHDPKGGNPAAWPDDLNVRQMPEVTRG